MTSAKEVYRYLDGNDLQVVVSGLTIGKAYKLRVLAFSNGGDGKMSSPVREFKIGMKLHFIAYLLLPFIFLSC